MLVIICFISWTKWKPQLWVKEQYIAITTWHLLLMLATSLVTQGCEMASHPSTRTVTGSPLWLVNMAHTACPSRAYRCSVGLRCRLLEGHSILSCGDMGLPLVAESPSNILQLWPSVVTSLVFASDGDAVSHHDAAPTKCCYWISATVSILLSTL